MITWWPFVDHLLTTCWPFDDYFWLFSDQSVTTYWSFGDYLVTIWWPLYQLFFSSSSVLHSVTTWWLLSTIVQFLFFAPVSTAHPPAFGAYWYFRQFCHDIYFLKALSDMYTIKSKSREIYTILPYDDITIIIIIKYIETPCEALPARLSQLQTSIIIWIVSIRSPPDL